ncbi:MAG: hypothetical protein ACREC5_08560, partial [Thermoplasmata archaeon]
VFSGLTLGLLEGMPSAEATDRFLLAAARLGRRRGLTVAVLPTAGSALPGGSSAGGLIRTTEGITSVIERPFSMRAGLTDTGLIGVVLLGQRTIPETGTVSAPPAPRTKRRSGA